MKTTLINKLLTYFSMGLVAFFSPIAYAIWSVLILIFIDTVTGVMKAGKSKVIEVRSKRMGDVVYKIIYYLSAIVICQICTLYIDDKIPFVKLALVAITIIEVKSIDENFRDTFGFSFIDRVLEATKMLKRKD